MKKLIFLMTIGLFILSGCSPDEDDATQGLTEQITNAAYVLRSEGVNTAWESVLMDEPQRNSDVGDSRSFGELRAKGRMGGFGLPTTFTGVENNGQTRGFAILQTSGPEGTAARLVLRATSIVAIGENEVVYGGRIINVLENTIPLPPPPPPCPTFPNCPPPPPCSQFTLGSYVYFAVKDNGQGPSGTRDQFKGVLLPSCSELPDGGESFPWFIFPWSDVAPGDVVLVSE